MLRLHVGKCTQGRVRSISLGERFERPNRNRYANKKRCPFIINIIF